MSDAPRPAGGGRPPKLLYEVSAVVDAPAAQVRALIDGDWLLKAALGQQERARTGADPADGHTGDAAGYVDVDRAPGMLGLQGHWWYRGEWTVDDTDESVRIEHRVYNIAPTGRWAVPLANKLFIGYAARLEQQIEQLARDIEKQLADPTPN